ncbi:MAG: hypothetical protein GC205_06530 [Bacteroidetes bacterium]|nr:hypothetical protein [Bacteroidota bacterium]
MNQNSFSTDQPLQRRSEALSTYKQDSHFYGTLDLLLTVKSFDLQAIRRRYLASRGKASGVAGSVERREPSPGGIVRVRLRAGVLERAEVLCRLTEPRGIDARQVGRTGTDAGLAGSGLAGSGAAQSGLSLAIAAENAVHWRIGQQQGTLRHPWFSYLHTVQFHPQKPGVLLVSSSGFDYIAEFDVLRAEQTASWLAWEHGFNQGLDPATGGPVILTRQPREAERLQAEGRAVMLVPDPPLEAIPTARRAAFINSVTYDGEQTGEWLATFFHQGSVLRIARNGSAQTLLSGLRNPHGGRSFGDGLLATSTASGEVVWLRPGLETRYAFQDLPGKDEALGQWEWIQNSLHTSTAIVSIDSNRTSFILFDPINKLMDKISYDMEWAVQDAVLAPEDATADAWLRSLG